MPRWLVPVAIAALSAIVLSGQAAQTPDTLARALQQHYSQVNDFKADFEQGVRSRYLPTESRAAGTVAIKKPGRMRWEYTKPEKQLFISDGIKIYNYNPAERRVDVSDAPSGSEAPTFLLFLAGKGDITRDFTASAADAALPGTVAVTLTPRKREADYASLVIAVDQKTMQLRQLIKRDEQGGLSTITFRNLKENTRIPDATFAFKPPPGVQIVSEDDVRRP